MKQKKVFISIMLLFSFCFIPLFSAPCGDVDSNGAINIVDALMTAQYSVGLSPQPFDAAAADVNADGMVNIVDALKIAQYSVGLGVTLECAGGPTPTPVEQPVVYELQAEDAAWDEAGIESNHSGYTGTGYVNTANSVGSWIEWSINISNPTNAILEFRYACAGGNRSMDLIVNGVNLQNLVFPATTTWDSWAIETAAIGGLVAGANTIRLTSTTGDGAPNMDKLDATINTTIVTPSPTATPTPTFTPVPTPTLCPACTPVPVPDRLRVMMSSDIGGTDNDDQQSMVHFLVYTDLWDVEGLISSPWGRGRASDILECIDAYEADYSNLVSHSPDYPTPDYLRSVTKQGAIDKAPSQGFRQPTEASEWIAEVAMNGDPRPLWITVWGGIEDLAQALHDHPEIESKLRVYWIAGPNRRNSPNASKYIANNHKNLWIIEADETYRGFFNGGDTSGDLSNNEFPRQHVAEHGELGKYFMSHRTTIKMGDTPAVLYTIDNEVRNPGDPTQPGWGGAFIPRGGDRPFCWKDNPSQSSEGYDGAATVNIHREAFLRDFQARMDRAQSPR